MAVVWLCFTSSAVAQFRTSIQGVVTDPTGAVIPGATLTLKNLSTNETITRTSDAAGVYNFNALPADRFQLTVERNGFKKKVLDQLQLIPEQPNGINVQLQLGELSSTVTVNAATQPALDTETANTAAHDLRQPKSSIFQSMNAIATSLIRLVPGSTQTERNKVAAVDFSLRVRRPAPHLEAAAILGHSSSIFATENGASANANGGQFDTNGYSVDGISTESAVWGGATVITPSEDSIGNIQVLTNAYDAENGRFTGAVTEITSKSGTNNLHGSFFVQVTRPGLNAYQSLEWSTVGAGIRSRTGIKLTPAERGLLRDEDRYNQLGGSIGGPIWKNRVFAFFAYEGQYQTIPASSTQWFPTTAFAQLGTRNSIATTYLHFQGASCCRNSDRLRDLRECRAGRRA